MPQDELCKSCRNYHGKTYNGVKFYCAMYPSGNGNDCPDYEYDRRNRPKTAGDKLGKFIDNGAVYIIAANILVFFGKGLGVKVILGCTSPLFQSVVAIGMFIYCLLALFHYTFVKTVSEIPTSKTNFKYSLYYCLPALILILQYRCV